MAVRLLKTAGLIIALANILNVISSTWFFLGIASFPVPAWLAFNACAPSVLFYLAGYFMRKDWLMAATLPFLIFFGTAGLFLFSWSGTSIHAQIGHICMTLAALWIIAGCAAGKRIKNCAAGLAAGIVLFMILFLYSKLREVPSEYLRALGDSTFEKFRIND
jgi:hypothetical protein